MALADGRLAFYTEEREARTYHSVEYLGLGVRPAASLDSLPDFLHHPRRKVPTEHAHARLRCSGDVLIKAGRHNSGTACVIERNDVRGTVCAIEPALLDEAECEGAHHGFRGLVTSGDVSVFPIHIGGCRLEYGGWADRGARLYGMNVSLVAFWQQSLAAGFYTVYSASHLEPIEDRRCRSPNADRQE